MPRRRLRKMLYPLAIALLVLLPLLASRVSADNSSTMRCLPSVGAPNGSAKVTVSGTQLLVQKRNSDGTLGPATPYTMRGVNWSPASATTDTFPEDRDNADDRRAEFAKSYATDIPLLKGMNVNTVLVPIDLGTSNFNCMIKPILDQLYQNSIMVILTVDDGNNDTKRAKKVVALYKNHPAVLMWLLGNEWNLNKYFHANWSVLEAARRTQVAAKLIKSLDSNHPVATSLGEIAGVSDGSRLEDTTNYVRNICTSVDVWSLNIYRGNTFGNLFTQWQMITPKPMFLGEFGADAFRSDSTGPKCPTGAIDEASQANWDLSLWSDLSNNLSANDPSKVAIGGNVFEWTDEWWKFPPPQTHRTCGTASAGQPDGFANEEYFGVVDINRMPRQVYKTLQNAFAATRHP